MQCAWFSILWSVAMCTVGLEQHKSRLHAYSKKRCIELWVYFSELILFFVSCPETITLRVCCLPIETAWVPRGYAEAHSVGAVFLFWLAWLSLGVTHNYLCLTILLLQGFQPVSGCVAIRSEGIQKFRRMYLHIPVFYFGNSVPARMRLLSVLFEHQLL